MTRRTWSPVCPPATVRRGTRVSGFPIFPHRRPGTLPSLPTTASRAPHEYPPAPARPTGRPPTRPPTPAIRSRCSNPAMRAPPSTSVPATSDHASGDGSDGNTAAMTEPTGSQDPHAEHRDRKRRKRMQLHGKASVYLIQQAIARAARGEVRPAPARASRRTRLPMTRAAPRTAAVLTVSDRGSRGESADTAGPAVRALLEAAGFAGAGARAAAGRARRRSPHNCDAWADEPGLAPRRHRGRHGALAPRSHARGDRERARLRRCPAFRRRCAPRAARRTPMAMLSRGVAGVRGAHA